MELETAREYQKSSRKWYCMAILLGAILVAILVLPFLTIECREFDQVIANLLRSIFLRCLAGRVTQACMGSSVYQKSSEFSKVLLLT